MDLSKNKNQKNKVIYELANWQAHMRNFLTRALAPINCKICGAETNSAVSICSNCTENFLRKSFKYRLQNEEMFCKVCGKEMISEKDICQRCKKTFALPNLVDYSKWYTDELQKEERTKLFFEQNFALFPYIGDGQKIINSWKNKGLRNYANLFSEFVFEFLQEKSTLTNLPIIPVPPRPSKLKTRGWDQINDMVNDLKLRGKTILKCLKRYDGLSQKYAGKKERSQNLKGKFYLKKSFEGKMPERVILLDDIITTGATINECSKVLLNSGCKTVYTLCLFFDA